MAYTIIRPKDRTEWLGYRTGGIGSSEVGTILGVNPYETPYQLWRRKMEMDAPKDETFAMKAGHYLEDAVACFFSDSTGAEIIKASAGDWLIVNQDKPFLRVSPDRTYWAAGEKHSAHNKRILECKTTQKQIDEEDLPAQWICQLTYQLGVAELEQGALAWLTAGRSFGYKDLYFDKELWEYMTQEVEKFWVDNILGKQEPLSQSVEDVLLKNPRHLIGKTIQADNDMILDFAALKNIKEEIATLDKDKKEIENRIKMAMQDAESVSNQGETLATWKASKDGVKFDEKRFKAENPELYARYQVEKKGTRTFLLK